jgi:hypothetical protein
VTLTKCGSLVRVGMILAGLALGGYVYAAWPDGHAIQRTPAANSQQVRAMASVDADPELELAGVAGSVYPGVLFAYEFGPTPFIDAVIAAPPLPDAE